MYLTYNEYQDLGGALDDTTFSIVSAQADAYIDWYTFNRLWGETEIPERVKRCVFTLIPYIYQKMQIAGDPTVSKETLLQGNPYAIRAQSNDDVKIEYSTMAASETQMLIDKEMERAVKIWLSGVVNSLGRKLLYRGLYPGE